MMLSIIFPFFLILINGFTQVITYPITDLNIDLPYEPAGPNATTYDPKVNDLDFCKVDPKKCRPGSSHPQEHVACKCHEEKRIKNKCKPLTIPDVMEFRKQILQIHNSFRNFLASGKDSNQYCGEAANMNAISYDLALEHIAMCTSIKCEMEHDLCRTSKKYPTQPGQNIYAVSVPNEEITVKELVNLSIYYWYGEKINVTEPAHIDRFNPNKGFGHFSTMLWSSVTHVGCGATVWIYDKNVHEHYLTCNYGALDPKNPIDMTDNPTYARGKPASKCERKLKRNSKYSGLCGEIEPIPRGVLSAPGSRGYRYRFSAIMIVSYVFVVLYC